MLSAKWLPLALEQLCAWGFGIGSILIFFYCRGFW